MGTYVREAVIAPSAPGTSTADSLLREAAAAVDTCLAEMPETFLEARRVITRELGLDPCPEQLQTLMRLSLESPLPDGLQELAKRFVRVRVAVDGRMRELFGKRRLRSEQLQELAETIPPLLEVARGCERDLLAVLSDQDGTPAEHVDFLLQVGDSMRIPYEEVLTGMVLAPRLSAFAAATGVDALRLAVPSLSESEAVLATAGLSEADASAGGPSRVGADALALRTLLREGLDRLEGRIPVAAPDGPEPWPEPCAAEHREALLARLRRGRVAVRMVVSRLKKQQDAAVSAGLHDVAEELRRIARTLYAEELRLVAALRAECPEDGATGEGEATPAHDTWVDDSRSFAAALEDVRREAPGTPSVEQPPPTSSDRFGRRHLLTAVAAALAILSLTVHAVGGGRGSAEENLPLPEIRKSLPVTGLVAAGSILVAEIAAWELLDDEERLERTARVGRQASDMGFDAAVLVDPRGIEIAHWSNGAGPELVPALD